MAVSARASESARLRPDRCTACWGGGPGLPPRHRLRDIRRPAGVHHDESVCCHPPGDGVEVVEVSLRAVSSRCRRRPRPALGEAGVQPDHGAEPRGRTGSAGRGPVAAARQVASLARRSAALSRRSRLVSRCIDLPERPGAWLLLSTHPRGRCAGRGGAPGGRRQLVALAVAAARCSDVAAALEVCVGREVRGGLIGGWCRRRSHRCPWSRGEARRCRRKARWTAARG